MGWGGGSCNCMCQILYLAIGDVNAQRINLKTLGVFLVINEKKQTNNICIDRLETIKKWWRVNTQPYRDLLPSFIRRL